jgi:hypothetical protein
MPAIYEDFKDYKPPITIHRTIDKLLGAMPARYLSGLQSIVLTDSASIGHGKTSRVGGRKLDRKRCQGFYHGGTRDRLAWIEITVDNVIQKYPPRVMKVAFIREIVLADTLYHEIGHHLIARVGSGVRNESRAADEWSRHLSRYYFRKHHPYLMLLARPLVFLLRVSLRSRSIGNGKSVPVKE